MKEQLERIKEEALRKIEASDALEKLNDIRVAYLGKKGELTTVLKNMKNVAPEERPKVGQMVNDARALIEAKMEEAKSSLARKARASISLPCIPPPWARGTLWAPEASPRGSPLCHFPERRWGLVRTRSLPLSQPPCRPPGQT